MTMRRRGFVSALALCASLLAAQSAGADEKQACVAASEKAQQLRNAGKLGEAREQLAICGRSACPRLVQQDCTTWMSEVLAILPSIVPGARDRKGRDIVEVKVFVDGKMVTETLDGKPIAVDPGVHTFRFETRSAPPIEEQVVVRQNEKNRILTVTFATPGDAGGARVTTDATRDPAPPIAAYVVGGVGLVGLGVGAAIGVTASSDASDIRDSGCAPRCDVAEVDAIQSRYTIAGVTAGIGGALLVAGVVMLILHVSGESRSGGLDRPQAYATTPGGIAIRF
ncbi:MAG: hypothetical protein KF819_27025 [Labilithrix sp.]|nr:hypothetical protein [Labilithrix sp.]